MFLYFRIEIGIVWFGYTQVNANVNKGEEKCAANIERIEKKTFFTWIYGTSGHCLVHFSTWFFIHPNTFLNFPSFFLLFILIFQFRCAMLQKLRFVFTDNTKRCRVLFNCHSSKSQRRSTSLVPFQSISFVFFHITK